MKPKPTFEQMGVIAQLGTDFGLVSSVRERMILPNYQLVAVLRNEDDTLRVHTVITADGQETGRVLEKRTIVTVKSYGMETVEKVEREMITQF